MSEHSAARASEFDVRRTRVARALIFVIAALFAAAALLGNEWLLAWLQGAPLDLRITARVRSTQLGFGVVAALTLALAGVLHRSQAVRRLATRRGVTTGLLVCAGLSPLFLVDAALRPFVRPKTTLFVPDEVLGWRLVPGAEDDWGGVPVRINAQGLRGPDIAADKAPGESRVLFLGDSVSFGYGVERDDDLFAFRVARALEASSEAPVRAVLGAVGGWSPWQQLAFFESEGPTFRPDLVVVTFVLNDVTEKLALVRYGGRERGWQLDHAARGALDRWLSASAIASYLRDGVARLRFGRDVAAGARQAEDAQVRWLAANPERPELRRAWRITFESLRRLFALARERGIPAALLIVPYQFQLEAPRLWRGPQHKLRLFADSQGIPVLDLLSSLTAARRDGATLFLDASHLSVEGHRVVAENLVRFVATRELLPDRNAVR